MYFYKTLRLRKAREMRETDFGKTTTGGFFQPFGNIESVDMSYGSNSGFGLICIAAMIYKL